MAIREILKMGDPRLLGAAHLVENFDSPALHRLVDDMLETMHAAEGVGLAAPQIGESIQLVVFGFERSERYPDAEPIGETVLINPTITPLDEAEEDGWEGCLSVPGLRGWVPRFQRIRYSGFNHYGEPIEVVAEGFHARVVQHECDHLHGLLYPMRIRDFTRFGFTDQLLTESCGD